MIAFNENQKGHLSLSFGVKDDWGYGGGEYVSILVLTWKEVNPIVESSVYVTGNPEDHAWYSCPKLIWNRFVENPLLQLEDPTLDNDDRAWYRDERILFCVMDCSAERLPADTPWHDVPTVVLVIGHEHHWAGMHVAQALAIWCPDQKRRRDTTLYHLENPEVR